MALLYPKRTLKQIDRIINHISCLSPPEHDNSDLVRTSHLFVEHSTVSFSSMLLSALPCLLRDDLVAISVVPLLTIGKEVVNDKTTNGEDEDENGPQKLVADRAARLEDLDCELRLACCV